MRLNILTLLILAITALTVRSATADVGENWIKNCAACHGRDGSGDTVIGKRNNVKDYRDAKIQSEITNDKAASMIREGSVVGGKVRMKSFKDILTSEEIDALVIYFRAFAK
jgi:mono/diheme cytochrome c family protein